MNDNITPIGKLPPLSKNPNGLGMILVVVVCSIIACVAAALFWLNLT
jgi:hypothetical protein